jgi:hypothetical protein
VLGVAGRTRFGPQASVADVGREHDSVARAPRQPWLFLLLALGFGVVAYFASGEDVVRGILGGLLFAVLISAWLKIRKRLW